MKKALAVVGLDVGLNVGSSLNEGCSVGLDVGLNVGSTLNEGCSEGLKDGCHEG